MSVSSLLRCSILAIAFSSGCATVPPPPTDSEPVFVDPTPPELQMSSQGLRHNILLDRTSKKGALRRVRSTDKVEFLATALDKETGVRFIRLQGELKVNCLPAKGKTLVSRVEPIHEEIAPTIDRVKDVEIPPRQLSTLFSLEIGTERLKCPAGRFRDMTLELAAETVNGQGRISKSMPVVLRYFGADQLRVGAFNAQGGFGYSDTDYLRWGATLGRMVDILILNGIPDRRRAELIATMAGMPNVAVLREENTDVAIASKSPLTDVRRQVVAPAGELNSRNSNILSANAMVENYPVQILSAHFGIHDANSEYFGPEKSSPSRYMAAQALLDLIVEAPEPAIAGGGLNAYSGVGPQLQRGAKTKEIDLLLSRLLDPFIMLKLPDTAHCSDQRVDYLMSNISYVPSRYEACSEESAPSNHPFILVTFEVP